MAYRVDNIGADAATRRRVFEFAKSINAPLIITGADAANPAELDKLAEEFEINVALESKGDPKVVMAALQGRGKRMGVSAHLGGWAQAGIKASDGLAIVKDKLLHITAADRSALNARARAVPLGEGAAASGIFPRGVQGGAQAAVDYSSRSDDGSRHGEEPAGVRARDVARDVGARQRHAEDPSRPDSRRRSAGRGDARADRRGDSAPGAGQTGSPAQIARHRHPDVFGAQHDSARQLHDRVDAKYTGAFEPTFSNDQELLKYPKIKEFDAVFFNNVCGMVHNDPEVREGILRYVREGGGLGGNHAVTYANLNWPEFADMMGGWAGQHRVEEQVLKIDDPSSPLMKPFGTEPFTHTDEFYIFPPIAVLAREAARVDEHRRREIGSRIRGAFQRAQHAARSGLRRSLGEGHGKGRTYFTPLGHTTIMYTDKRWTAHLLAAIQYVLGDISVDETPSAKAKKTN